MRAELDALLERIARADLSFGPGDPGEAYANAVAAATAVRAPAGEDADARDLRFMAAAVALARAGTGATYPNPCVGAVVVAGDEVVGAGHSAATGGPHAEVRALAHAGARARGATVYVTLEPCSHVGRTPPCTDALLAAGVAEVVYGVRDPARHAAGRSNLLLAAGGVRVREGVGAEQCAAAHEHYLHHERTRRPFVTLKAATSLDGRIAAASGDSRWITGEPARTLGHWLRARHHAIAVGADTALRDDPQLSARLFPGVDPLPVIVDSRLRTAAGPRLQVHRPGAIAVHTEHAPGDRRRALADVGVQLVEVPADAAGRVDVGAALAALGRLPIRSLLVEGGGRLLASFVAAAAWERWYWFQAPRLLGDGTPVLPGLGWPAVAQAPRVLVERRAGVGDDELLILAPGPAGP
jgi:diaminohydroxyphosphoribosylaminopyrimidine deaminase/5-amino-6-(5-phosphoribosylamino)uracil reductase